MSNWKDVDFIIVGAGLAGAAFAWQSHLRGLKIALIERSRSASCSRSAAGLVTPITGSRFAPSWAWNDYFPHANQHYKWIESTTAQSFWHIATAHRIFLSEDELHRFHVRWCDTNRSPNPEIEIETSNGALLRDAGFAAPQGTFSMMPASRLDTVAYLNATLDYFETQSQTFIATVDCYADIEIADEQVTLRSLGLRGKRILFCQGFAARENRLFNDLPLHPARGDMLTVESNAIDFDRVVHHEAWSVPLAKHQFLIGATYDRHELDTNTASASALHYRSELMRRWESMTHGSFETGEHRIIEHRIGIRPASYDRRPLIGQHRTLKSAYCMNGLGSKGSLMSPFLASQLLDNIYNDVEINQAINCWRRDK